MNDVIAIAIGIVGIGLICVLEGIRNNLKDIRDDFNELAKIMKNMVEEK